MSYADSWAQHHLYEHQQQHDIETQLLRNIYPYTSINFGAFQRRQAADGHCCIPRRPTGRVADRNTRRIRSSSVNADVHCCHRQAPRMCDIYSDTPAPHTAQDVHRMSMRLAAQPLPFTPYAV